ncbi:hypothetical protein [Vibrio sp. SCSIO 43137]|uniref:hypothetical protein n=1 Tax=Vibrio sp. SCSIO 43137 TaxID=3021011 RepID=UPI0023073BCA|nr:hypothetical protein [Vibrio sp. SCSIO 43137]WCE30859.1 hypothetical protein PK654_06215 [Vibrio sp. SCSIO 43137]
MKKLSETVNQILHKTEPESVRRLASNHLVAEYNEPKKIGLSIQSVGFELAASGECAVMTLEAENNGQPVMLADDFSRSVEIDYDSGKLRIHDISIASLRDFKKVIRDYAM